MPARGSRRCRPGRAGRWAPSWSSRFRTTPRAACRRIRPSSCCSIPRPVRRPLGSRPRRSRAPARRRSRSSRRRRWPPRPRGRHAILGAGAQGRAHAEAFARAGLLGRWRCGRATPAAADELVAYARSLGIEARGRTIRTTRVRGADVVTTCTGAATPLFDADAVADGAHLNAVGACVARPARAAGPAGRRGGAGRRRSRRRARRGRRRRPGRRRGHRVVGRRGQPGRRARGRRRAAAGPRLGCSSRWAWASRTSRPPPRSSRTL